MTPAYLALAKDVDRLFRARRDNVAQPGEEMPDGGVADRRQWRAAVQESNADEVWKMVLRAEAAAARPPEPPAANSQGLIPGHVYRLAGMRTVVVAGDDGNLLHMPNDGGLRLDTRGAIFPEGPPARMRSRHHVAVLALVERAFFDRCVAEMDARAVEDGRALLALLDDALRRRPPLSKVARQLRLPEGVAQHLLTERACGRLAALPPPAPSDADVLRTGAYLEKLQARLAAWRKADVVSRAVAAEREEARLKAEADARDEAAAEEDAGAHGTGEGDRVMARSGPRGS